jgi:selenocysteine lyase/cysteine desulfurase
MENKKDGSDWSRRDFVSILGGASLAGCIPFAWPETAKAEQESSFPAKNMFAIKGTFVNAAYTHPMSLGSYQEIGKFLNARMLNRQEPVGYDAYERASVAADFARLINADKEEIAWIPSTMVGENLIVSGLGLPGSKEHVVTDAFHFHGSLHLYGELEKQGLKLTVVKPRNNRIDLNDLDAAITPGTKLVAVSLVSATTGFQHDLKKVCELAHSRGALVYADIIQAAGAIPIDVKDSQVDFCACSTYKWLMGDFGVGFLYVRKTVLPLIKRSLIGYRQIKNYTSHFLPFDSPGSSVFDSSSTDDMSGHFEVGTFANEGIAAIRYSLDFLNRTGVDKIYQYRKPMIDRLQQELASDKRYIPLTPADAVSPIVSFAFKDAAIKLKPKLDAADINISVYDNMIRISPSFYNDIGDIDHLLSVLKNV